MPFDPKIVREPDDEDDLADEMLAELGAQLTADAQFLAQKYPARATRFRPAAAQPWLGRWRLLAAVASVALVAAVSLGLWANRPEVADKPTVVVAEQVAVNSDGAVPIPTDSADSFVSTYENLTAPEWEGLLDLLEQQSEGVASLSL